MNTKSVLIISILSITAIANLGMGRNPEDYDEEAIQAERLEKEQRQAAKEGREHSMASTFVGGIKQATVDNTADVISDTAEGTRNDAPVIGTLEGARKSTEKVLDNTVKGAAKIATLGYVENPRYEVEDPKKGTDDTTKIKFKF